MKSIVQNTILWPAILMVLGLIVLGQKQAFSQLVINEVCPANFSGMADEDGDFEDWFELYNGSADTINLKGYSITDNPDLPDKWVFPEVNMAPQEFLVFFASDKNRSHVIKKHETAIVASDTFNYINPTSEPEDAWRLASFQDTAWLKGKGGFGHGEGIYNTTVSDTLMSVFIRKIFDIRDLSSIINAQLHVDYDDSFVAFLNGTEIARSNIRPDGTVPLYNQAAWRQHASQMLNGGLPDLYTINYEELMHSLTEGNNVLALQLHNNWLDAEMSINSWLSFGLNKDSSQFSETPEWFFNDTLLLHTGFKLDSYGESVLLFDPDENLISSMDFPEVPANHSFGCVLDGDDSTVYFSKPTPGSSNNQQEKFAGMITKIPQFSLPAGFYMLDSANILYLNLNAPDTGFVIRYTTDGNLPSDTSFIFQDSISITETTVIKARLFSPGMLPGKIATNTYIINKSTNLPVVSVSSSPHELWDYEEGIYEMGPEADDIFPYYGANFWDDKEIRAYWEFFGSDQQRHFCQDAGMKIHGNWSRAFAQRSLRLTARSDFGASSFEYPVFPDKNIQSYKKLILRNGGNDFQGAHMRDALINKMIQPVAFVPVQDYQPAAVYINGEYWGIHNIREKIDKDYLIENFAIDDEDEIDLLENVYQVVEGDNQEFIDIISFVLNHDLSDPENFDIVASQIDLLNLMDYFAIQLFIVNTDWPQNNVKYWKQGDGKWQYIFMDADNSMSFNYGMQNYTINAYERIINNQWIPHSRLFFSLLENEDFKHRFINRYADLMNTIFNPIQSLAFIDTFKDSLIDEMAFHKAKWGGSVSTWETYHIDNKLKNFFTFRSNYVRDHTIELFDLSETYRLYLHTENAQGSRIRINSVIPETYPWHGYYFDSVPVRLKALPAPGMAFSHWEENGETIATEQVIWWHLEEHDTLTAFFTGTPDTLKPTVTEINYASHNDMDAGDWIELYNPTQESMDLSGWQLKNELNFSWFVFDTGTIIQPESFLLVVQDITKFNLIYPELAGVTGGCDFGFRSSSSEIRLFDKNENLIINLTYNAKSPWPEDIAYSGRTIELADPDLEMHNPDNWQAGCLGGSPGQRPVECHENPNIIFTEFNYNASDHFDTKDWVEIFNHDTLEVDLSFWKFKDDHGNHIFSLPCGTMLSPGEFLVLCSDTAAFRKYYDGLIRAIGNFDFGLSSSGDHLRLYDPWDNLVSEVDYLTDAPWPQNISGTGRTAEINNIDENTNMAENWRDGCLGGSPGKFPDPCHDTALILVSEINHRPHGVFDTEDWFEIFNNDTIAVSLEGWSFRDADTSHIYLFPDSLIIQAGEYLVVVEDSMAFAEIHDTIPNFIGEFDFGLSGDTDEIILVDQFGQTIVQIAYQSSPPWPENEFAPGRTLEILDYNADHNNPENWFLGCFNGSPGKANSPCSTSDAVIVTEIKFDADENADSGDWFEIFNSGNETVSLYGWTFSDSEPEHKYQFPEHMEIFPDNYLVVVQDSTDFLAVHDTIPNFVGEFGFGLSADGDEINLFDGYRQEVAHIVFETEEPWPENPYAPGRSIELLNYTGDLNNPENWKLGCSLGSPGEAWFECDDVSIEEMGEQDFSFEISPNPFDDQVEITIHSGEPIKIDIRILDMHGQLIKKIFEGPMGFSERAFSFNTANLKSGIYFLQLKSASYTTATKLIKI